LKAFVLTIRKFICLPLNHLRDSRFPYCSLLRLSESKYC